LTAEEIQCGMSWKDDYEWYVKVLEVVMAYLKVLPQYALGRTEENHKNLSKDSQ
jgi:hypothetical protein